MTPSRKGVLLFWNTAGSDKQAYHVFMLANLRAELKAIRDWPCGMMVTETEKDAVAIRAFRAIELENLIAELVSRNEP
jgi:hypothetical protein